MSEIRTAVIGVGYLGKFHAQKYSKLENSKLIAVVDTDINKAREIAKANKCDPLNDYHDLLGNVDAISIVVPTNLHFEIAAEFLNNQCHVLVEKPISTTIEEAEKLINLAEQNKCVLQVGHLERFNPAMLALERELMNVSFIESHRLAPYNPRGADVNVVLDLMIHDIDIILEIVGADIEKIDASGTPVLSDEIDIANARIVFKNGCVANVTASRVSTKTERKMRIFQNNAYISVDYQHRELAIYKKGKGEMFPGIPNIESTKTKYEESDALLSEIDDFLHCIEYGTAPKVTGKDGKRALHTATQINNLLS